MPFMSTTGGVTRFNPDAIPSSGLFGDSNGDIRKEFTTSETDANRRKGTFACCYKPRLNESSSSNSEHLISTGIDLNFNSNNDSSTVSWEFTGEFQTAATDVTTTVWNLSTVAKFRDPGMWYHVILTWDTTQATDTDRVKIYVNGVDQELDNLVLPSLNALPSFGKDIWHFIGIFGANLGGGQNFKSRGYGCEYRYIPGHSLIGGADLTLDQFGSFDTEERWMPARLDGSFPTTGNNRFYFPDPSSGTDASGNGNNFTKNGTITSTPDTPTNNAATLYQASGDATNTGNKGVAGTNTVPTISTYGMESGQWVCQYVQNALSGNINNYFGVVRVRDCFRRTNWNQSIANLQTGGWYDGNGNFTASGGLTWANGDVITMAWDADTGTISYWKNQNATGAADFTITNAAWVGERVHFFNNPSIVSGSTDCTFRFIESEFTFDAPANHRYLVSSQLDTIDAVGNDHIGTLIYSGDSTSPRTFTGLNFMPDFSWFKRRNAVADHRLHDVLRGTSAYLESNTADAEATSANVWTPQTNGFELQAVAEAWNITGGTYASWHMRAGGAGVANTDGTINSTVSASPLGFMSLVSYTANGTNGATVGHGLPGPPDMIIIKNRSTGSNRWPVYWSHSGATKHAFLDIADQEATSALMWNNTEPTSSVFTIGSSSAVNTNGDQYIAVCFKITPGLFWTDQYDGNGQGDDTNPGNYFSLGFKPQFVMFKRKVGSGGWLMHDTARNPFNTNDISSISADSNAAEVTGGADNIDLLSDGVMLRTPDGRWNANGPAYAIMAWGDITGGGTNPPLLGV